MFKFIKTILNWLFHFIVDKRRYRKLDKAGKEVITLLDKNRYTGKEIKRVIKDIMQKEMKFYKNNK